MKTSDLWFKNAIVYSLDVDTFVDSNGDGIGDFNGLIRRLDHISGLGVTCIWLLPFFPSPDRDNGYDITNFYDVDSRLGTLGDFVEFTHQAKQRGLRVIIDLVINHTSIDHPWFKEAVRNPSSPYKDYYLWSKDKPKDADKGIVFPGVQRSVWSYHPKAKEYYYHRFYEHQPDLNVTNPKVMEELLRIMGFWLQLGVSGFRMDAAPFVIEHKGVEDPPMEEPFEYLRVFRSFLSWRTSDAILLAEANVTTDKVLKYFGSGDKLHMSFNFWANQHLWLAMVRERAAPLVAGLLEPPRLPETCGWANFLRNHDEIDLGRLTEDERADVYRAAGPRKSMQLYDRGIRRRLAPMLGGDQRRIELALSLMFSLPGAPVIWYGDEIGMGDDLRLKERNSVRTPMQWDDAQNGGFSTALKKDLIRPVISRGRYSSEKVNVEAQRRNPEALVNWLERLIRLRRECPEIGLGEWQVIDTEATSVFALCYCWDSSVVVMAHNLGREKCVVHLDLSGFECDRLIDLFGDSPYRPAPAGSTRIELNPNGYRWFRLNTYHR